jgi:hypothetical protein
MLSTHRLALTHIGPERWLEASFDRIVFHNVQAKN